MNSLHEEMVRPRRATTLTTALAMVIALSACGGGTPAAEGGKPALDSYLRNASLPLREKAAQTILKL